ncbi:hypothetical protein [Thermodesulfatator atlanticus]|uniref:hypothetical protein n=1 Tax=Thermodesulfatator atlanticus TaxID=501497 RepID=UPI0003B741E2|nr:hypothetical protein [Thermodesulfatator atlanticus]
MKDLGLEEKDIELLNRWLAGEDDLERVILFEKGLYEKLQEFVEKTIWRGGYLRGKGRLIQALKNERIQNEEIVHEFVIHLYRKRKELRFENWGKFFAYAERTLPSFVEKEPKFVSVGSDEESGFELENLDESLLEGLTLRHDFPKKEEQGKEKETSFYVPKETRTVIYEQEEDDSSDKLAFCEEQAFFFDEFCSFLEKRRKKSLAAHLLFLKDLLMNQIEKSFIKCLWLFVFACVVLGFRKFYPCVEASRSVSQSKDFNRNTYQSKNRRLKAELLKFLEKNPELEEVVLKIMEFEG